MDPYSRVREIDTSYRNETLPKTSGHLLQGSCYECEEVRNTIRHVIGPYEDLITGVRKLKFRWYGHITRSKGLAKMILQGTVHGERRKGRQKKSLHITMDAIRVG